MKKQAGFITLIILLVAIVIVGGLVVYKHQQQAKIASLVEPASVQNPSSEPSSDVTSTSRVSNTTHSSSEGITTNASITANVTKTESCGTVDCFDKKFAACQPATEVSSAGSLGTYRAQILGPVSGGCSVTTEYLKVPNPDWQNKPMTCTYNNKIAFTDATTKVFSGIFDGTVQCTGPLYTALRASVQN